MSKPERVDAVLVAAGKYHDIDFARLELLKLLAEHPHVRVAVASDYADTARIAKARFLVTYTCDLRPTESEQEALAEFVRSGGRWLALHGTNSALDFTAKGVAAPRCFPVLARVLGSQFVAHPPIHAYRVNVCSAHALVAGIEPFETDDELYLSEYHDRERLEPLLDTRYRGGAAGFVEGDWGAGDDRHLVAYLRPFGHGAVLYNTLGHCRGHYDMRPVMDYYPRVERCSWERPQYYELLRRGIRWALGELGGAE